LTLSRLSSEVKVVADTGRKECSSWWVAEHGGKVDLNLAL